MEDLIKALNIFMTYLDNRNESTPTSCEHDTFYIMDVSPSQVVLEDKEMLQKLGFEIDEDLQCFYSSRFGSA